MTHTRLLTAEGLLALGDHCHCELVEGRLVRLHEEGGPVGPATPGHGAVASRSDSILGPFIEDHRLGCGFAAETGFRLRHNPDTVCAPDFASVAHGRITSGMDPSHYFDLVPDLMVEVVSRWPDQPQSPGKLADTLTWTPGRSSSPVPVAAPSPRVPSPIPPAVNRPIQRGRLRKGGPAGNEGNGDPGGSVRP